MITHLVALIDHGNDAGELIFNGFGMEFVVVVNNIAMVVVGIVIVGCDFK